MSICASGALDCAVLRISKQLSQHLPFEGKHNVDHLQAAGDFFQDAVLLPQLVQLPVALGAKVKRIAPSENGKTQEMCVNTVKCLNKIESAKLETREPNCYRLLRIDGKPNMIMNLWQKQ